MATPKTAKGLTSSDRVLQIAMAALGAILLLGSLGVVVHGAADQSDPAVVHVAERGRAFTGDRTQVEIEAVNRGDATASSVTVLGSGAQGQTASVTLDHLPGHSRKTATLTFAGDLGRLPLTLEATGWVDP